MNKFFYFKVTFLAVSLGLFVGLFVYGLFDIDLSNSDEIVKLITKSLATGIITGLIMGILNMFLNIGNFHKKEN
jgi:ABC-type Fe3+ transport system permease subunit